MSTDPYAGLAVPDPQQQQDNRPGYALTPQQDAAAVAAGQIPKQHVRIDPSTWQRQNVGGDPYAGLATQDPNSAPGMSMAEDMGRSAVTGLEQGVTGALGLPAAALHLMQHGDDAVGQAISNFTGGAIPYKQDADTKNGTILGWAPPTQADFDTKEQQLEGPYHTPQTVPGHYAQTVGQFAGGALVPGGLGERAAAVVVPALGDEGLGQLTKGTPIEPYARAAGALLGAGGVGAVSGFFNAPQRIAGEALAAATPEQLSQAAALRARAAQPGGVPLTNAEALAQVGGGTGLTRLQHFVENTPTTADVMSEFMAQRPAAIKAAVSGQLDNIAPAAEPTPLRLQANEAAQSAQQSVAKARSAITSPMYKAVDGAQVDPSGLQSVLGDLDVGIQNDKTGLVSPPLQQLKNSLTPGGQPLTDVGSLDTVRKHYRDLMGAPDISDKALTKQQAGAMGEHLDALDSLLEQTPGFAEAKAQHAALTRSLVDPLQQGPLSGVANASNVQGATSALYPSAPAAGAAAETTRAMQLMGMQPGAADLPSALTRQHVADAYNASVAAGGRGAEGQQYVGARLAHVLAGHPEAGAVLDANLGTLSNGSALQQQMGDFLQNLQATGTRQATGSRTAFNQQLGEQLGRPTGPVRALSTILDPLEIGRHLDKAVGGALYKQRVGGLADILLSDDPNALMRAQAATPQQAFLSRLLAAGGTSQQGGRQ